jgi:Family of unknown function (DUF6328)
LRTAARCVWLLGVAGTHYDPSAPVVVAASEVRRDSTETDAADQRRDETTAERLDRNTIELLNELRVAATGIQVLFAFLLVVPFYATFKDVSSFERDVYFVTLVCIATSAILLIAPSIHHRLLFQQGQRAYLVRSGNKLAIAASIFLSVGMTGILVLISDVVFGGAATPIVGVVAGGSIATLWFLVPLNRRRQV